MRTVFPIFRIIYDLCGGTGSWSKPYSDNGYDVRVVDIKNGNDIRWLFKPSDNVYGVLAAPPCTHFALSGAQYWEEKDADGRTLHDIAIMDACIRFIFATNPVFWALENPAGRMTHFLGRPQYRFNPCDFGDTYTKKTYLWGKFNRPRMSPAIPTDGSKMHKMPDSKGRQERRSIISPYFANAFFEANR